MSRKDLQREKHSVTAPLPGPETALHATLVPQVPSAPGLSPDATTMALLRAARGRLVEAERIIAEQEKKIRELEDLAATDALTGLMNRRGFQAFFEQELSRIGRGNSPGALLVLIDLDRFKQLNDTYGHHAGDACLEAVAEHLMDSIRFTDGAARLGGDEFAILLTQTDVEKAAGRVQHIRQRLNDLPFIWQGETMSCRGSLGFASVTPDDQGFANVYAKADAALYADKARRKSAENFS